MSQESLLATIQLLLTAPSDIDFIIFIYQHPEVHEEEAIKLVHAIAAKERERGQEQQAESLEAIAKSLDASHGQQLRQELAEQMKIADTVLKNPVAWAGQIRNYLSTKEARFWYAALNEASSANEHEVLTLLRYLEQGDLTQVEAFSEKLSARLHSEERSEEALTVSLLGLEMRAALTGAFETFKPHQQVQVLNVGLKACEEAIELAQALGDHACRAAYMLREGSAYRSIRYFAEAKVTFKKALWLHRVLAQKDPEHEPLVAGVLGDLSILQRESGELNEAERTSEESLARFKALAARQPSKYAMSVVIALNNLGNARREAGKNAEAEIVLQECLVTYKALSDPQANELLIISVLINLGNAQWTLSKSEEAERTFEEALSRCRALMETDEDAALPNLAIIFNGLNAAQRELGKLSEAEAAGREALAIRRELARRWPKAYLSEVAVSLVNLCGTLNDLGKLEEAEAAGEEAVSIRKHLAEKQPQAYELPIAKALLQLGGVRRAARRLDEAEASYEEALQTYERLASVFPEAYEPSLALLLNNLSNVLEDLGRFEEAVATCRKALAINQGLEARHPGEYARAVAMTFFTLGTALRGQGRLSDAEAAHEEALSKYMALTSANERIDSRITSVLNNLGVVKRDLGKLDEAKSIFKRAVTEYRSLVEVNPQIYQEPLAYLLNNLATVFSREGNIDEARAAFEEALKITSEKDSPDVAIKIRLSLGSLAIRKQDWNAGELTLRRAIDDVEDLRIQAQNLSRRSEWLEQNVLAYENLLLCLLRQGVKEKLDEAIVISERGKSRAINDLLATREFRPKDQALAQELDHWLVEARKLEDREKFFRWQLSNGGLTEEESKSLPRQLDAVHRQRLEAGEKLEQVGRKIRKAEPDFLPYAQTLSLEEIKQVAHDANATLLLFRVTEVGSFVFLVFPDGRTDAVEVVGFNTNTLNQLLVTFEDGQPVSGWSALYYQERVDEWKTFMEEALHRLYVKLMEPVQQRLLDLRPHMNGSERLVLVPNRGLTILPLHACWWIENGSRKYLFDEYVCAYAPSLYILKLTLKRKARLEQQDRLLGFANPHYDDPNFNLLFSEWECQEIQKLFGDDRCSILWREQATKERFLADANQSQLLHFACHGMYEMAMPLQSSLFLADAALEASEVMSDLDLRHTWLTVLSACETSLSDYRNTTDEQFGLPLGFLMAGAPTVWGTLWTVDDLSTALLIKEAYQNLKAGMNKPEALRAAQIRVSDMTANEIYRIIEEAQTDPGISRSAHTLLEEAKREYEEAMTSNPQERSLSHPYHWAGMQCVGL